MILNILKESFQKTDTKNPFKKTWRLKSCRDAMTKTSKQKKNKVIWLCKLHGNECHKSLFSMTRIIDDMKTYLIMKLSISFGRRVVKIWFVVLVPTSFPSIMLWWGMTIYTWTTWSNLCKLYFHYYLRNSLDVIYKNYCQVRKFYIPDFALTEREKAMIYHNAMPCCHCLICKWESIRMLLFLYPTWQT